MTRESFIRLSEACAQLSAAGIASAEIMSTMAVAGWRSVIVATGFRSLIHEGAQHDHPDRERVRTMTWRIMSSKIAHKHGYERSIRGDQIVWTHAELDAQERYDSVFVDRLGFDALLAEIEARRSSGKLQRHETAAWIESYPGTNSKQAWRDYRAAFGARACKRDEEFQPLWLQLRGNPKPGQPKKSPNAIVGADLDPDLG